MNNGKRLFLSATSRQLIYIIIVFISLLLFIISIRQAYPVNVEVDAIFGLASYLPNSYWLGLLLILITSIIAFIDNEQKKDSVYIFILTIFGLFLLGIRVFFVDTAACPDTYFPNALIYQILEVGQIDIENPPYLTSYYSWPAIHFVSAALLQITNIDLTTIIKYTPLLWIISLPLITYSIGKNLKLDKNRCFLLSFIAISAWVIALVGTYYARFPAGMFFLLIFMLLLSYNHSMPRLLALVILLLALIITHGLTTVAVLAGILMFSIYKRDFRLLMLFTAIFIVWYLFMANSALDAGVKALLTPLQDIFSLAQIERYEVATSLARLASRYSQLSYLMIFIILIAGSLFMLIIRKDFSDKRQILISIIYFTIGVSLIVFWGHGQVALRTFIYCIVPMACIIVIAYTNKKILIPLMCVFTVLSPIMNYSGEASWEQVPITELTGTRFFALQVEPEDAYFYTPGNHLILFHNPQLKYIGYYDPFYDENWDGKVDLSVLDELHYIIMSKKGEDWQYYSWGNIPYTAWLETDNGKLSNYIYNNGSFSIYENLLTK